MHLKGKTALVTGGAHRVGKAITLALAREGANVVINYRSSDQEAVKTAQEAAALGVETLVVQADISKLDQVKEMVRQTKEKFGSLDVFVNSASPFIQTPLLTSDYSQWHYVIDSIIHGSFYCANEIAPLMLEGGGGAMIFIVDLSALEPWPKFAAHSVSKAAMLALSKQLALELAPTVRVNAIAPGPVLPPPDYSDEKIKRTAKKTLLNRWGTAEDVAQTVIFLAKSDYITGDLIAVDGGERFGHRKHEAG